MNATIVALLGSGSQPPSSGIAVSGFLVGGSCSAVSVLAGSQDVKLLAVAFVGKALFMP
jgi:hypothetical protein